MPNCQTTRAPGGTRTHVAALTGAVSLPLDDQCVGNRMSVGSEGLEPSPGGLRVRCAAASTLIPSSVSQPRSSRRGGNRTLGLVLIRDLLSPLSYAPMSGAEGTRTLACRIKSPVCCRRYTTTPKCRSGVCVSIGFASSSCSSFPVVALRVELSTTRLSAVFGQPALDYLMPTSLSCQSGWQDSNLRSCVPKTHGFSRYPTSRRSPVRTGGFEPPISCTPSRRDTQTSLRSVLK